MKTTTSALMNCVQNKFIVINVIVVVVFLINTVFFHLYRVGDDKTEVDSLSDMEWHLKAGIGGAHIRIHGKRSPGWQRTPKYGPDLSKVGSSDKWIVVSLNHFNKSWPVFNQSYLSFLDTVHGWTSIVVGEAAGSSHGCKSCLLFPTPPRKGRTPVILKAFLAAVQHGARQIYVITSLHNVTSALKRMTAPKLRGVIYSGKVPFKPCSHFVQPLLGWGVQYFPACHDSNWIYPYSTGEFSDRNVIGVCDECGRDFPENEFINNAKANKNILYCDPTTPNVAISPESFVESVFENSLWHYDTFWAMFFYGIQYTPWTSGREKLKMSHVIQRLLWEINASMTFVRSHDLNFEKYDSLKTNETKREYGYSFERDYYNIESKLCRERDLSGDFRILGQFLYDWKCHENSTIEKCVTNLSDNLYRSSFIDDGQYKIMYRFIRMLNGSAYEYPDRSHGPIISVGSYIGSQSKSLRFWPSAKQRHWNQNPFHDVCTRFEGVNSNGNSVKNRKYTSSSISSKTFSSSSASSFSSSSLSTLSSPSSSSSSSSSSSPSPTTTSPSPRTESAATISHGYNKPTKDEDMSSIVLVIVFTSNDPTIHIQMVNFYDYMYGRHFRHIVYCTSGEDELDMFAKVYPQPMTVIDLKVTDTNLHSYLCMSEVMRMHHSNVDGYLHLDSETLLNPWTVKNLRPNLNQTWINAGTMKTRLLEQEVDTPNLRVGQMWKDKDHGRTALNSSLQDLLFISTIIDKHLGRSNVTPNKNILEYLTKYNKIVKSFIASINSSSTGSDRTFSKFEIRYGISVVFYIPASRSDQFIVLADEFSRYSVHSYFVIPTIVNYLDSNFLELNGTISTTRHTNTILSAYRSHHAYLYPWEMNLLPSAKRSKFMCNDYLPQVENSLMENDNINDNNNDNINHL